MERSDLTLLGEKTLPQTADVAILAYCPSMDLVAIGSTDQQVLIYRLNGQRVYGATHKTSTLMVETIRWKPNGQLLAIAWSDGSVRLVGAESSKIVHQFSTGNLASGITCIGWASNLAKKKPNSVTQKKAIQTWQEVFDEDDYSSKAPLELPRDLTLIDIETSLPKLSVLAGGGSSEEVFSSRASLDAIFRPFDPKDNDAVDVMVVGTKEGNIHLSIYDSFVVGSFPSPVTVGGVSSHLTLHASHEQYSTHSLLMKSTRPDGYLYFVPMDLRFVSASSHYLSLLASRSTALQNLLRYIHHVQVLMVNEWKTAQELPAKFLGNINETLGENGNRNIVQALYHSVATGHTFPAVREWLVDELTERGHKRWDKAVTTGLGSLMRLVHENMLPALERCSVILSRFMGIAKFQGNNNTEGFSSHQISLIMDTVACLHLVSSRILIHGVDELDTFAAFSSWLRYEIDRLASDPSNSSNEEISDKEALIDHSKVLRYLQSNMISSPLGVFFDEVTAEDYNDWSQAEQGRPMFDILEKQLENLEQGLPYLKPLPRVESLCKYLTRQANTIFNQIAEAEKRNVLFGKAIELVKPQDGLPMDMRMSPKGPSSCYTHLALPVKGTSESQIQIFQIEISIENGISTVHEVEAQVMQLGQGKVRDIKFLDDSTLLVLWKSSGSTYLLSIPYRTGNAAYHSQSKPEAAPRTTAFNEDEVLEEFSNHRIPSDGSFTPHKLDVRERSDKRYKTETTRIVVLGQDRLHYKVFSLPMQKHGMAGVLDEDIPMSER